MTDSMLCPNCLRAVIFEMKAEEKRRDYSCPKCQNKIAAMYVTNYKSHIPAPMAVIGMRGHGKTCYLGSLFNCLEDMNSKWKGFCISALDEMGLIKLRKIQRSLKGLNLPEPTENILQTPAVVSLSKVPGHGNFHLICHDISGEAFYNVTSIRTSGDYLSRVKTVVWLIDLTTVSASEYDENKESKEPTASVREYKFDVASRRKLEAVLIKYDEAILGFGGNTKNQSLLVALTKADRLKESLPERVQNYLNHENYRRRELDRISDEIKLWLENNHKLGNFLNLLDKHFKEVKYTLLSALGSEPQPNVKLLEITPRRVLDPLMFTLELAHSYKRKQFIQDLMNRKSILIKLRKKKKEALSVDKILWPIMAHPNDSDATPDYSQKKEKPDV